MNLTIHKHYL